MRSRAANLVLLGAMVSLQSLTALSAEPLGRLFFSAQERQALDQKRMAPAKPPPAKSPATASEEADAQADVSESVPLPPRKITGQVVRSSGNNTVWVNQYPQYRRERR